MVYQRMKVKVKVTELCPTLCDPKDCTFHEILQARILEWVAIPFSRGISPNQGSNSGLLHYRQILYQLSHMGSPRILEWVGYPFSSGFSWPRSWTGSPALQVDSLPAVNFQGIFTYVIICYFSKQSWHLARANLFISLFLWKHWNLESYVAY